jgi:hypothetical protein
MVSYQGARLSNMSSPAHRLAGFNQLTHGQDRHAPVGITMLAHCEEWGDADVRRARRSPHRARREHPALTPRKGHGRCKLQINATYVGQFLKRCTIGSNERGHSSPLER